MPRYMNEPGSRRSPLQPPQPCGVTSGPPDRRERKDGPFPARDGGRQPVTARPAPSRLVPVDSRRSSLVRSRTRGSHRTRRAFGRGRTRGRTAVPVAAGVGRIASGLGRRNGKSTTGFDNSCVRPAACLASRRGRRTSQSHRPDSTLEVLRLPPAPGEAREGNGSGQRTR